MAKSAGQRYVDKKGSEAWARLTPAQQEERWATYWRRKELWRNKIKPGIITAVAAVWLWSVISRLPGYPWF